MTKALHIILFTFLSLLSGCIGAKKGLDVKFKDPSASSSTTTTSDITITSVAVTNNQLVINGTGLGGVTSAKLSRSGVEQSFTIESASATQIIANGAALVTIAVGNVFDLILSDAEGSATFAVSFTLDNHSVDLIKLKTTGATTGQVLKFNGTDWVAASIMDAQIYAGTWDASNNIGGSPDLSSVSSTPGEYYIVSVAGTLSGVSYSVGDWIISNGSSWQKVAASKTAVTSFQGRKGIVTLTPADYVSMRDGVTSKVTGSKIADIADVDLTGIADGKLLKWDATNSKWIVGDDTSGTGTIGLGDLSASAPLSYNSTTGAFSISAATTSAAGSFSSADKTKIDSIPGSGDGLFERFSGTIAMKSCSGGEMLVWLAPTGWSCTTGAVALTMGMSRNTTANTAGSDLTLQASGATSSATDKNGGSLVLSSGVATGTGSSTIEFKTATASSTGVSDNTPSTKMSILGNGNVGIGTTSPNAKLSIKGTGTLAQFTNSANTPRITILDNGYMGVNVTNDPVYQFQVQAGGEPNTTLGNYSGIGLVPVSSGSASPQLIRANFAGGLRLAHHNAGGNEDANILLNTSGFTFNAGSGASAPSPIVTFLTGGNVGIGTTSPTARLSVTPGSTSSGAITMTATNGSATFTTSASTTLNVGDYLIPTTTTGQARAVSVGGTGTSFTASTAFSANVTAETYTVYPAAMNVNSGKLFVQGSTGNVGVGNTAPSQSLEVNGNISLASTGNTMYFAGTSRFIVGNSGQLQLQGNAANGIGFFTGASDQRMTIDSSGNVGIGTITPSNKLSVTPSQYSTGTASQSATTVTGVGTTWTLAMVGSQFVFANGTSAGTITAFTSVTQLTVSTSQTVSSQGYTINYTGLQVSSTGNVGIGTSNPSTALQVDGSSTFRSVSINNNFNLTTSDNSMVLSSFWGLGLGSARQIYWAATNSGIFTSSDTSLSRISAGVLGVGTGTQGGTSGTLIAGNVGIGTSGPSTKLHVLGSSGATIATFADGGATTCTVTPATTGFACSSDSKLKKNIKSFPDMDSLDKVLKLRTVTYNWRNIDNGRHTGYIAQEVEKIAPEFVRTGDDGYKQVSYAGFIPWITGAIKAFYGEFKAMIARVVSLEDKTALNERAIASVKAEAKRESAALREETLALKKENEQLKARLEKIEKLLDKAK